MISRISAQLLLGNTNLSSFDIKFLLSLDIRKRTLPPILPTKSIKLSGTNLPINKKINQSEKVTVFLICTTRYSAFSRHLDNRKILWKTNHTQLSDETYTVLNKSSYFRKSITLYTAKLRTTYHYLRNRYLISFPLTFSHTLHWLIYDLETNV